MISKIEILSHKCVLYLLMIAKDVLQCSSTMETKVTVDCHSKPDNILIKVKTSERFDGLIYVSERYGDTNCTAFGVGNFTTFFQVPIKGCSTKEIKPGLFMSHVTVQQNPMIVSAGDGEYKVGCKLFRGDLKIGTGNQINVGDSGIKWDLPMTSPAPTPDVLLRIYDFENDVFVNTVKLGQVVELEITIRDGKSFQGSVSDCDAISYNGTRFPLVRNFCPVDTSISDKVYVDDQSRTTGDYYLYIPFKMFRFLDGEKVKFSCNVIICQHDCPWADCGDYLGMSYGRKKRSPQRVDLDRTLTVTNEVTVSDDDHRLPRSSGTGFVIAEDAPPPKLPSLQNFPTTFTASTTTTNFVPLPTEYVIGGVALLVGLLVSVFVNIYLVVFVRRKLDRVTDEESVAPPSIRESPPFINSSYYRRSFYERYSPKQDWNYESSREILYPPMPLRHARNAQRSHSFRY